MERLTSANLIQIDATVIAGLLILLTISSISSNSIINQANEIDNQISDKNIEQTKYVVTEKMLEDKISKTNDTVRKQYLQDQSDIISIQLSEVNVELDGLHNKAKQWSSTVVLGQAVSFIAIKRTLTIAMFVPFVASIFFEVHASTLKKYADSERSTNAGKIAMIVGFVVMIMCIYSLLSNALF